MNTVERPVHSFPLRRIIRIDVEPPSEAEARNRERLLQTAKTHSEMLRLFEQYQQLHQKGKATPNDVESIQRILVQSYAEEEAAAEMPVFLHRHLVVFGHRIPLPSKRAA